MERFFWDLRFRRDFHDWEMIELQILLALLHKQVMVVDIPDTLRWGMGKNGMFSDESYYEKILVRNDVVIRCNAVWISKVPWKVCFFPWLATRGVTLMVKNLRKRKAILYLKL